MTLLEQSVKNQQLLSSYVNEQTVIKYIRMHSPPLPWVMLANRITEASVII